MKNGTIGVTTENIFPVIKKFLYSDHEIFLREIVANAVDASQKMRTIAASGAYDGELGELKVSVKVDTENKTLTVSDNGVGMTAEEVDRYINQIAFSSAEEFMEKYKDQAIIGHFGLGFYSSFMVSRRVEIRTQSYHAEEPTMLWSCDGSPEYTLTESDTKRERGTDIIMYLADDCTEFADQNRIREMLKKYCRFLPIEIVCGKQQEWKNGKYEDTERDYVINDTDPLWTRKPTDITEEQYKEFYSELYPTAEEPLFSIHLNIDYPFNLTGILYFPKIRNNFEVQKNRIQLYCNQVYVTDSVEGIVPEYLTLLHGVIDSPDIPLNVSRSYLQSDSNVKKISSYITRKVGDRLQELFNTMRPEFESKWDDLKIFIEYGIVTDEKFAEKAQGFTLLKNSEGKYFTPEEYKTLTADNQTDKHGNLIWLYTDSVEDKYSFVEAAKAKGYDILVMDGPLDGHFIGYFENKNEKTRFVRVDSNVIDKLIEKEHQLSLALTSEQQDLLRPVFESQLPNEEKIHYSIAFEAMAPEEDPITITRDEFMRRMKEMAQVSGGGMSQFYAQMPDSYTIAVNGNHPLVAEILGDIEKECGDKVASTDKKIQSLENQLSSLEALIKDKKEEELTPEERTQRDDLQRKTSDLKAQRTDLLKEEGKKNVLVKQLIDLALLSNGMLKGESLTAFIRRSVKLIHKQ
ncbi:MAG: molecular chaperone HtpG [Tidjanibacter sp.]|nr:molecular chaperone HtpG [Tidjanibacter sp.]